ncbi:hypothetical protein D3C85_377450 [compost metagenome]
MKPCIWILIGMTLAIFTIGHAADERVAACQEYCEMVQLWKDTKGDLGWPDYRKAFEEECGDE